MASANQIIFDTTDVAYIFKAFLDLYKMDPDNEDICAVIGSDSEMDKMAWMMEVAIEASLAITEHIDFTSSNTDDVWAYDHLVLREGEDTLPLRIWRQCVWSTMKVEDVVRMYAEQHGYALEG